MNKYTGFLKTNMDLEGFAKSISEEKTKLREELKKENKKPDYMNDNVSGSAIIKIDEKEIEKIVKEDSKNKIEKIEESKEIEEIIEIEESKPIEEIIEEKIIPINIPELEEKEMFIFSDKISLILNPKEIYDEGEFFVLILEKSDKRKIFFNSCSRMKCFYKYDNNVKEYDIFYSGIFFVYDNNSFLIFHKNKD